MSKLIVEQLNITQVTGKLVNLTVTQHPRFVKLIEMLKLDIEDVSVAPKTIKVLWSAKCLEGEHQILIGVVDKKGIIHTVMLESDDPVEFYGNWYGYPKCCIDEFKVRNIKGKEASVFDGTGYVACPECRKKDPSEILEHIANNRLAPFPFNLRNNAISEILDVVMYYNVNSEMQEKHKEINLSVSTSTDEITLMQFSKLVKGIESCENTRPELKKELITLREEVNQILYNFENGEDQPENSISSAFDKIQQYKKYF